MKNRAWTYGRAFQNADKTDKVRKIVVNAEKINVFPAQGQAGPRKIRWLLPRDAVYIKRGEIVCFSGLFNLIYINLCLFTFI